MQCNVFHLYLYDDPFKVIIHLLYVLKAEEPSKHSIVKKNVQYVTSSLL